MHLIRTQLSGQALLLASSMGSRGAKLCGPLHLRRRVKFCTRSDLIMDPDTRRDFFTVASLLALAEPEPLRTACADYGHQRLELVGSVLVVLATLLDVRDLQSSLGTRKSAAALATHILELIKARCLLMDAVCGCP